MDQPRSVISKTIDFRVASNRGRGRPAQFTTRTSRLSHTKQIEADNAAEAQAIQTLSALSTGSKRKLKELTGGAAGDAFDYPPLPDDGWQDDDDDNGPLDPDIEVSAEGGEAEHLQEYIGGPKRKATQTNASRINTVNAKWTEQLPALVDAYLQWQHAPLDAEALHISTFALQYVDVFDYSTRRTLYHLPDCKYMNATLLHQGCLGPMPDFVYVAFSVRTLELYRSLRVRQPRLSIQAWVRVICDTHNVTYNKTVWRQFNDAFDLYLKILQGTRERVDGALGRTAPDWRVKHSCPPCQYKLTEEPELEISIMGAIDGNSSLKRVKLRKGLEADPRQFASNYFISAKDVDHFKNDVKSRSSGQGSTSLHADHDMQAPSASEPAPPSEDEDIEDPLPLQQHEEPTPIAGDEEGSTCAERWKAAMSDSHKRMWDIYQETGVFLSACRHALIWWLCDMIRSGELAKYPLAIIARILQHFPPRPGIGYDIGCTMEKTVGKSSIAQCAVDQGLRLIVNAFHGWAHNRFCQLRYHPLYVTGFGIEDLETCERIFSASNGLAPITRYASQFHRHQAIDLFMRAWDDDKYEELSAFLLNNYRQVEQLLDELPRAIAALQEGKTAADTDYHKHLHIEREYLAARKKAVPEETWRQDYVELLIKFQSAKAVYAKASVLDANPLGRHETLRQRARRDKAAAFKIVEQMSELVKTYEDKYGIYERWTSDTEEWKQASESIAVRKYRKALDKLEGLVVQRLFELSKLGLSGTGYKMCMHINKSLKTRCRAIRSAMNKYNTAARAIGRQELDWKDVSTYGSLAEFELLRECRVDIRSEPWTQSANRQAANHSLKVERAKEERIRLNVEVRRLATWMRDEEADMTAVIARLQSAGSHLLAAEVSRVKARRQRVHRIHRERLAKIYALPSFTGDLTLGIAMERPHNATPDSELDRDEPMAAPDSELDRDEPMKAPNSDDGLEDDEGAGADEDDAVGEELDALHTFMEGLSVVPID